MTAIKWTSDLRSLNTGIPTGISSFLSSPFCERVFSDIKKKVKVTVSFTRNVRIVLSQNKTVCCNLFNKVRKNQYLPNTWISQTLIRSVFPTGVKIVIKTKVPRAPGMQLTTLRSPVTPGPSQNPHLFSAPLIPIFISRSCSLNPKKKYNFLSLNS